MKSFKKITSLYLFFLITQHNAFAQSTDDNIINQFKQYVSTLSHDSLEGRRTGEKGELIASKYIAAQFQEIGLTKKGDSDSYYQVFDFVDEKVYGISNQLEMAAKKLKIDEEYFPLYYSANNSVTGDLVFVGYGISAPEHNHDDYKNLNDLNGKIFLMEYSSPDGLHPHSKFLDYSDIRTKIDKGIEKGAAGIIFINSDDKTDNPENPKHTKITPSTIPVVFANIITDANKTDLLNQKTVVSVEFKETKKTGRNVIGFLDNNAKNTIVIGAHYDHLGFGELSNSLYRGKEKKVHNGADDNASGTAVLISFAKDLKKGKANTIKNNYLFIAFSGEEMGLLGSRYFVNHPTIPLKSINYMLNMDMVGRLDTSKNTLLVMGSGTSPAWKDVVLNIDTTYLKIKQTKSGVGPSDHTSFYLKEIPVLHFFTGTHNDYHKPSDDEEKINYTGMKKVYHYMLDIIIALNGYKKLQYTKTKDSESNKTPSFKVTLGVIPDYSFDGTGMKIDGTSDGKPAQKAGLQAGDIIIQMGEIKILDMMSYMKALSKFKKGDSTIIIIKRKEEMLKLGLVF